MKKNILALPGVLSLGLAVLISFSPLGLGQVQAAEAEVTEKTVFVKGMVCAFCAQGIERQFSDQPELEGINVDLPNHKVVLKFKPGQSMSDETIASLLEAAGYSVDASRTN